MSTSRLASKLIVLMVCLALLATAACAAPAAPSPTAAPAATTAPTKAPAVATAAPGVGTAAPAATKPAAVATAAPAAAGGPAIKLASISPLTGASAATGIDGANGSQLAVKQINDAGGILGGRKLELSRDDDKSLPEEGVGAFKKVTDQGVKFIMGTMNSSVANAIGNLVINNANVMYLISGAQTQTPLDQQTKGNIFGYTHTNDMYGKAYDGWIINTLKPKTIYILAENSDFGSNEIKTLQTNLVGPGAPQIVGIDKFERTETDLSSYLTKIKAANVDAWYLVAAAPAFGASVMKQADDLGLKATKLRNPGNASLDFIQAGGKSVEGVVTADIYVEAMDTPMNKTFAPAYRQMFNSAPSPYAVLGYDSAYTVAKAMDKAGTADDLAKIGDVLRAGSWDSPRGTITFDKTGRAQSKTLMVQVKNGNWTVLGMVD